LEVSKQTVFNNKKRLNIETVKQDNTSFIKNDVDVEKIIQRVIRIKKKYGFESTNISSEKVKTDNKKKNESKYDVQIIELLEKQIDTLNKQLEKQEKRHETTIEFYRKELQERSKLLENQQVLALESNKKIQKLESQLEEEKDTFNYSFDTATNNRQNIDPQEATFTEESQNINQQQTKCQPTEVNYKDIAEEKENDSTNEGELIKEDKFVEETKSDPDDNKEVEPPKKGFWSRFFGN
jgi:acetolactate synthase regulatory subunit